jgi:hypothetical protein
MVDYQTVERPAGWLLVVRRCALKDRIAGDTFF